MSHYSFLDLWQEKKQLFESCPSCQAKEHPMQMRIIDEADGKMMVHALCKECHNAIMAHVIVKEKGVAIIGIRTDLSYEDFVLVSEEKITSDDVLEVHDRCISNSLLKDFAQKAVKKQRKAPVKKTCP